MMPVAPPNVRGSVAYIRRDTALWDAIKTYQDSVSRERGPISFQQTIILLLSTHATLQELMQQRQDTAS